ncbi:PerC family transcriptional regulator [Raoultella planticola]|uniref:PerC family transcriptional regulator n=1 Tax=Raoultella planticola TaxID=575 RepID=UPI00115A55A6|nr:PerC family transcriptional regulator [Raoultella planticola]
MVSDSKAEELEVKGLYRRAATRWMEVMNHCAEGETCDWGRQRMDECLHKVRRPPARAEDFGGLHKAAKETQHRMGIAQPNGEAFRIKEKKVEHSDR